MMAWYLNFLKEQRKFNSIRYKMAAFLLASFPSFQNYSPYIKQPYHTPLPFSSPDDVKVSVYTPSQSKTEVFPTEPIEIHEPPLISSPISIPAGRQISRVIDKQSHFMILDSACRAKAKEILGPKEFYIFICLLYLQPLIKDWSRASLAKELGTTQRSLDLMIGKLAKKGYITFRRKVKKGSGKCPYILHDDPAFVLTKLPDDDPDIQVVELPEGSDSMQFIRLRKPKTEDPCFQMSNEAMDEARKKLKPAAFGHYLDLADNYATLKRFSSRVAADHLKISAVKANAFLSNLKKLGFLRVLGDPKSANCFYLLIDRPSTMTDELVAKKVALSKEKLSTANVHKRRLTMTKKEGQTDLTIYQKVVQSYNQKEQQPSTANRRGYKGSSIRRTNKAHPPEGDEQLRSAPQPAALVCSSFCEREIEQLILKIKADAKMPAEEIEALIMRGHIKNNCDESVTLDCLKAVVQQMSKGSTIILGKLINAAFKGKWKKNSPKNETNIQLAKDFANEHKYFSELSISVGKKSICIEWRLKSRVGNTEIFFEDKQFKEKINNVREFINAQT